MKCKSIKALKALCSDFTSLSISDECVRSYGHQKRDDKMMFMNYLLSCP